MLADLPQLVEDVRVAGVPVTLHVEGDAECIHAGIELSAYRVVQEALTNVIKHAGEPTRVDVTVRHLPGAVAVEVVDDGRGVAAQSRNGDASSDGSGHGLIGSSPAPTERRSRKGRGSRSSGVLWRNS